MGIYYGFFSYEPESTVMPVSNKIRKRHQPQGVIVLHEDRDIVVIDKAPGLLTMGTGREQEKTAYYRLTDYVRKGNHKSRERIFIVHRLDRDVSGILLFARTEKAKVALQTQWESVEKHYLALVSGQVAHPEGVFESYLMEEGVHRVRATDDPKLGKLARTSYKVLGRNRSLALLDVSLHSGRKHQIRVHLADNGLPIVGDKKYGDKKSSAKRLGLHAKSLAFKHPGTGEACVFETRVPHFFARLLPDAEKSEEGAPTEE